MDKHKKLLQIIFVLFIAFVLFKLVDNAEIVFEKINGFLSLLNPFFWAFFIAYLLNPMMVRLEKHAGMRRTWSIMVVYVLVIGMITIAITLISPRIMNSIGDLLKNMPSYVDTTQEWVNTIIVKLELLERYEVTSYVEENINTVLKQVSMFLDKTLNTVVLGAIHFTSSFFKFVIGLIISIYLLKDKEVILRKLKIILYGLFSNEKADQLIQFGKEADMMFSQFIIGKMIDSLIIGLICYLGLLIMKIPYPLLLSLIVGVTNMIPYFGPFIGMIPCVLITLFSSPIQALWVLVFIFLLQQFDGMYLGPKILGDMVGLSPIWIILAIIVGGGAAGVWGMFLAVPIMAIIKVQFERYIQKRIQQKNLDFDGNDI
ncbi:MAG: AI-2E family transporter [Bacillota bacterium]